jgi:hypothetical protein
VLGVLLVAWSCFERESERVARVEEWAYLGVVLIFIFIPLFVFLLLHSCIISDLFLLC